MHCLAIHDLHARNVHPSAYFPDMLTPHTPPAGHPMIGQRFLLAHWLLLPPSGGIAIMDRCELHLHPVRVQLELRVGRLLTEYLLGARRAAPRDEARRPWLRHLVAMSRKARSPHDSESDGLSESASDDSDNDSDNDDDAAATPLRLAPSADDAALIHLDALGRAERHQLGADLDRQSREVGG